ncbi:uncharacterized protein [Chelonus insularis]|uniref:uncharacterized protein n=1 Tax=Chelonus insularis TaxID=460826 RepID=UPI00158DB067|nr:uncharacterized protein LOC118066711 [Chelonus insularis]
MEIDECSAGGDSAAEEEEDEESFHGSRSNSCTSSTTASSSTSESAEESAGERDTTASETHSSGDEDENNVHHIPNECADEVRWETCIAAGSKIKLPQDLCEHLSIFHELLDFKSIWQDSLNDEQRKSLAKFLPSFPKDCDVVAEQEKTLKMLFQRENQRFGVAPVDSFHHHLSSGHFRPDIKRMRHLVKKAQQRRLLFEERKRTYELANQLFKSRESLLLNAYKQGFSQPTSHRMSKLHWRKPTPAMVEEKTQIRYVEELKALRTELGVTKFADTTSENEENCLQFQMPGTKQKKKRKGSNTQVTQMKTNQLNHEDEDIRPVFSTLQREEYTPNPSFRIREMTEDLYRVLLVAHKKRRARQDIHPELNTQGIILSELSQRAQVGQKHKITISNSCRVNSSKKRVKLEQPLAPSVISNKVIAASSIKSEHDNTNYLYPSNDMKHISNQEVEIKECQDTRPSFSSVKVEASDSFEAHPTPTKKKVNSVASKNVKSMPISLPEIKREMEELDYMRSSEIKSEYITPDEPPPITNEEVENLDHKKELDLENIDMMQIPIQLGDGMDILDDVRCDDDRVILPDKEMSSLSEDESLRVNGNGDLMQETHACFFSLLRDAFLSKGEYRMSVNEVKDAVTIWQSNPITPLNDWYSLVSSWSSVVPSALGFLAGELIFSQDLDQHDSEFVPYLENKGRSIYAWIGAGRDSDSRLSTLNSQFLMNRSALITPRNLTLSTESSTVLAPIKMNSIQLLYGNGNSSNGSGANSVRSASPAVESISNDPTSLAAMMESEPPRALCPTDWKVRLSTPEEREEFRRQERLRYASPHKAFTYRMHGYESVVGPVKGIYQHNAGAGLTKPRGHSLLVADRPNFVTILALVRDATARLPNGEGTRADICMLLKDSQYIKEHSPGEGGNEKDNYLNSVVSGALDRLHYEADPCVRYYPRRKEWLYLHRARSESEFEMYHQQLQGVTKAKKNSGGSARNKAVQPNLKLVNGKEQSPSGTKETPKKEKKVNVQTQSIIKKEQRIVEEKVRIDQSISTEQIPATPSLPTTSTASSPVSCSIAPVLFSPNSPLPTPLIERETPPADIKPQITIPPVSVAKKISSITTSKPVAVMKTSATQSLLQSNQHFPHHQIQVSTSAGLQTIRLSGPSVLQSAQTVPVTTSVCASTSSPSVTAIFSTAKIQNQSQQTVLTNQTGKSILQSANLKQQQQHVLPGKTLLASQIKLVSSGQIKSLLTGHGLQGQTIFIKQSSPSTAHAQQIQQLKQQQQRQLTQQLQQRFVLNQQQQQQQQSQQQQQIQTQQSSQQQHVQLQQAQQQTQSSQSQPQQQQQQQTIQAPGMQRIIAQIGGKPIAVQIQQSPHQQQQQKILAKVLTSASGGQLISVESLLAQKGLKLAATTSPTQVNRQGKQVIQTQYQVVSQAQTSPGQAKIVVTSQQQQTSGAPTVRMVTAQLAGKPIVLASANKSVGVGISGGSSVVLGKQSPQQQTGQQPIILPSQLLNIKTLHGLKVIPTPAGLKTAGAAVYARVIAPTTISTAQTTTTQQQQATLQTQAARNNPYGAP